MRMIDQLHLEHPFMGARMLKRMLLRQSVHVGRRHLGTLMERMGIQALCPQPGTSKRHPQHKIYPYLLRKVAIQRANQVWALDTTYIPMARGFVYLTAEEFTHAVLSRGCRLSMDGKGTWRADLGFCHNVFVERLWRTIKYERVYLRAYDGVSVARADLAKFIDWYNTERPHSSLDDQTPDQTYWARLPEMKDVA